MFSKKLSLSIHIFIIVLMTAVFCSHALLLPLMIQVIQFMILLGVWQFGGSGFILGCGVETGGPQMQINI